MNENINSKKKLSSKVKKIKLNIKKTIPSLILILLIFLLLFCIAKNLNNNNNDIIKNKYTYIKYGIVTNVANIYVKKNNEYKIIGTMNSEQQLEFILLDEEYLRIKGFDNKYYIHASDVKSIGKIIENNNDRYKKYIYFNKNIITKNKTKFYNEKDELIFTFNLSYNLPIIIKDDDKYGIEFNNQLLFVKKEDVITETDNVNTTDKNINGVVVLNYHFFYDETLESDRKDCNQIICKSIQQFQKEIDYIKNNNIFTVTTNELEMYIDGKINLPKSVLITIDDGWRMDQGIDLLEKNELNGCVFLITGWYNATELLNNYRYVEFHSHGDLLHDPGVCSGGQGGAIKCLNMDTLVDDLTLSSERLHGSKYFAYPFYEYNNYSIEVLKKAGYTMAFAGVRSKNNNLVVVGDDKYRLPRFPILSTMGIDTLDGYFSKVK